MILKEIVSLLNCHVLCGEPKLGEEVNYAFASDLMSDVLTIRRNNFLLITGLANIQAIRTAEMSDVQYILFVRGKEVSDEMRSLAEENDMVILASDFSMFKVSGILYKAGMNPVY